MQLEVQHKRPEEVKGTAFKCNRPTERRTSVATSQKVS